MSNETYAQQTSDSEMIFTAISSGAYDNFDQAQQAVVLFYVPDLTVSRAGISHALERLERHYTEQTND
ncbi:MAG: hypothetical protein FVQ79_00090 [Planctomycetes bacterium]|nr:hypothetical protein [Planctomycetota bacterium]